MWFCFSSNTSRSVSFYTNWRLLTGQVGCRIQPTLDQSFPPFVREQTKCISDGLMIRVVTGNSTSRDLTNYDCGFGSRVQDFLLDFWLTSTSTNQLRVIKICQYQPAWDHQGVYHRRFDWDEQRQCPRKYKCRSQQIHSIFVTKTASISANLSGQLICLCYAIAYSYLGFLSLCMQPFLLVSLLFYNPVVSVLLTQKGHLTTVSS